MIRTYVFPLNPNKSQEYTLEKWLEACCYLRNTALEQRIIAYKQSGKSVSLFDQQKQLTDLRSSDNDNYWSQIPVEILRSALTRLDLAYKAFFRRIKLGLTPGFPRFKSRYRYDSFSFGSSNPVIIKKNKIQIPNLGLVKFKLYRDIPLKANIKEAHIRRSASGRWKMCLVLDLGDPPPKVAINTSVGIDVGLTTLATLSDDKRIENIRFYRESESSIAKLNQELARKQKDSNNRFRARVKLAKAHERIKNQRINYLRHKAKELVTNYDLIIFEDLQIKNMVRGNLGKSINDASWNILMNCTTYKAEEAGKYVIFVNPWGTSQECSRCGMTVTKELSERIHNCPHCGLIMHRDLNGAKNIQSRGLRDLETLLFKVVEREASN